MLDIDRDGMTTAIMARVSEVEAGEQAMAVEREPDAAGPAVATGHVSALGLRIDTSDGGSLHDMIEAAIETTPASEGAVLCSGEGSVLGLVTTRTPTGSPHYTPTSLAVDGSTTTTTAPAAGMATLYATPIDYAAQVADEIIATGTVKPHLARGAR